MSQASEWTDLLEQVIEQHEADPDDGGDETQVLLDEARDYFKEFAISTHVEHVGDAVWVNAFFKDLSMINTIQKEWELFRGW